VFSVADICKKFCGLQIQGIRQANCGQCQPGRGGILALHPQGIQPARSGHVHAIAHQEWPLQGAQEFFGIDVDTGGDTPNKVLVGADQVMFQLVGVGLVDVELNRQRCPQQPTREAWLAESHTEACHTPSAIALQRQP